MGSILLLPLLMKGVFLTPPTMLLQRNFTLDQFPVLPTPIISALALLAGQSNELILGHNL